MIERVIKTIFQLRYDTKEKWEYYNPILRAGEPGFEIDTGILKIGDGVNHWIDLKSISGEKDESGQTCITPEMFGAVGDGITDDTDAFQMALDASTASLNIPPDAKWSDYNYFGIPVIAKGNYKITRPIHTGNSLIVNGCIHYYDYTDTKSTYNLLATPKNTKNENGDNVALSIYCHVYNEVGEIHNKYSIISGKKFKINIINEMPFQGNRDIIDPVTGKKGIYEYTDDKTVGVQFINCKECDIELTCINSFYIAELFECRGMSIGTGNTIKNGNIVNFRYGIVQLNSNDYTENADSDSPKMRDGSFDENIFIGGYIIGASNESTTKYKRKYAEGVYVSSKYNTSDIILNYRNDDIYEIDISKRELNDENYFAQKYDNILSVNSVIKVDKNGNKTYCKPSEYTVNNHGPINFTNTQVSVIFNSHLDKQDVSKIIINYTSEYSHQCSGNIFCHLYPGYLHNSFVLEKCRLNYFYNIRTESVDNSFILRRYCQDNYIHIGFEGSQVIKDDTCTGNVILNPKEFLNDTYSNIIIDTGDLINKCATYDRATSIPNVHEINEPKVDDEFIKGPFRVSNNCNGFITSNNGVKVSDYNGSYFGGEITTKDDKKVLVGFNGDTVSNYYKYIPYEDIPETLFKYVYFNYYTIKVGTKEQKFKKNTEYKKVNDYYEILKERPGDWDDNTEDYFTFSSSSRITPSFVQGKVFDDSHNVIMDKPSDWESTYTNYRYQKFTKTTDNVLESKNYYIPISFEKVLDANDDIPISFRHSEWYDGFYYIDNGEYKLITSLDMNKDIYAVTEYELVEFPQLENISNYFELSYKKISATTPGFGNKSENQDKQIYEHINTGWRLFTICKDKDGKMIKDEYKLLLKKPSDWEYNYTNYYSIVGGKYSKLTLPTEFESNTYYELIRTVPIVDVSGFTFNLLNNSTEYISKLFKDKIDSDLSDNYLYMLNSFLSENEIIVDVPNNVESVYIGLMSTDKDLEINRFYLRTFSNESPYRIASDEIQLPHYPDNSGFYDGQIIKNTSPTDECTGWSWYNNQWNILTNNISAEVDQEYDPLSTNAQSGVAVAQAIANKTDKPVSETITIPTSSWSALADSAPFDYSATVTITTTLGENSTVELINNNALLFANYGFSILSVSGQTATIASIGQPDDNVTLKVVVING